MKSPVSRDLHKRLVGALSTLAAEGTINKLRRALPPRQTNPSLGRDVRRGFPGGESRAAIADNLVSGVQHLPGDVKSPLDI